jgi:hypothetical protein
VLNHNHRRGYSQIDQPTVESFALLDDFILIQELLQGVPIFIKHRLHLDEHGHAPVSSTCIQPYRPAQALRKPAHPYCCNMQWQCALYTHDSVLQDFAQSPRCHLQPSNQTIWATLHSTQLGPTNCEIPPTPRHTNTSPHFQHPRVIHHATILSTVDAQGKARSLPPLPEYHHQ